MNRGPDGHLGGNLNWPNNSLTSCDMITCNASFLGFDGLLNLSKQLFNYQGIKLVITAHIILPSHILSLTFWHIPISHCDFVMIFCMNYMKYRYIRIIDISMMMVIWMSFTRMPRNNQVFNKTRQQRTAITYINTNSQIFVTTSAKRYNIELL